MGGVGDGVVGQWTLVCWGVVGAGGWDEAGAGGWKRTDVGEWG